VVGIVIRTVRARLLQIPSKIAARIRMVTSVVEAQAIVSREINEALSELSRAEVIVGAPSVPEAGNG
jgi:hypothetical protein